MAGAQLLSDDDIFGPSTPSAGGPQAIPAARSAAPALLSDDDVFGASSASLSDYPVEFGKGVVQGVKTFPAGALKGVGAIVETAPGKFNRDTLATLDRIDAGEDVTTLPDIQDTLGYRHMTPQQRAETRATMQAAVNAPERPVNQNPLYRAGQAVEDFGSDSFLAPRPGFEGRTWTRDIGSGFGSVAGAIAANLAMGPVASGALFVSSGMGEAADNAVKAGATHEQIRQAASLGSIPGATDVLDGLLPSLGNYGRALGFIKRVGLAAVGGALAEGGQEGVQQLLQNAIQIGIYNPNHDIMDDVPRSAAIGAIVGAAVSGGVSAAERHARAAPAQPGVAPGPVPAESIIPAPEAGPLSTPVVNQAPSVQVLSPSPPLQPSTPAVNAVEPAPGASPFEQAIQGAPIEAQPPALGEAGTQPQRWAPTDEEISMMGPDDYFPPGNRDGDYAAGDTTVPFDGFGLAPVPLSPPSNEASKSVVPPGEPSGRHTLQAILDDPRTADELRADFAATDAIDPAGLMALPDAALTGRIIKAFEGQFEDGKRVPGLRVALPRGIDYADAGLVGPDGRLTFAGLQALKAEAARRAAIPATPGSREAPVELATPADVHVGAEQTAQPTPAQAEAGNYAKRHLKWNGLDIAIETEAGGERAGIAGDGTPWSHTLAHPYGYFKGTEAVDGDQVDVYVGPHPQSNSVFVVDQVDPDTHRYDEPKVVIGARNMDEAASIYRAGFNDGSADHRMGAVTEMSVPAFKTWLEQGNTKKPIAYKNPRAEAKRGALSLFEFLAKIGGLKDHGGELRHLGLDRHFIPGFGRLVRATGKPLDAAREAAAEMGYLDPASSINDLLDLLAQEASGQRVYSLQDVAAAQDRETKRVQRADDERFDAAQEEVRAIALENKAALTDTEVREIATLALVDGMDVADAFVEILERGHYAATGEAVSFDSPQELQDEHADVAAGADQGRAGEPQARQQPARPAVGAAPGAAPNREQPGGAEPDRGQARAVEAAEPAVTADRNEPARPAERVEAPPADGSANQSTANQPTKAPVHENPRARAGRMQSFGRKAFADGQKRLVPREFTNTEDMDNWYRGWDAANIAAPDGVIRPFPTDTGPVRAQEAETVKGVPLPAKDDASNFEFDPATRVATEAEARQHGGQYTAVARRLKPWAAERGYGDTPLLAQNDALRRLKTIYRLQEPKTAPEAVGSAPKAPSKAPEAPSSVQTPEAGPLSNLPAIDLANDLLKRLREGKPITAKILQNMASEIYGSKLAEGQFNRKDIQDALELAVNLRIKENPELHVVYAGWQRPMQQLDKLLDGLPTQRVRSEEQESFQQFSTPPNYAAAAVYVANLRDGDLVLEPSAGTGSLIAAATRPGVRFAANELSERRVSLLRRLVGKDGQVFNENAEQIDNILDVKPSVVVMNPPFSRAASRMGNSKTPMAAAQHIEAALNLLQPGGRLVAIVQQGMTMGAPTFRAWWTKIGKANTIVANMGVAGGAFEKYGTSFGTRLIVIDKVAPQAGHKPVLVEAQTVNDLMRALEPIRDGRPNTEQHAAQPGSAALAEGSESGRAATPPATAQPGGVGDGERGNGRLSVEGTRSPDAAGRSPVQLEAGQPDGVASVESGRAGQGGAGEVSAAGARLGGDGATGSRVRAQRDLEPAAKREPGAAAGSERVELETNAAPGTQGATAEISESLYQPYEPARVRVKGAKPHPGPLVESASMSSVAPPQATYEPHLPKHVIEKGELSLAQLETTVYAGQAHSKMLPAGEGETPKRRGYFIGDGTGVGKGREIAGIILDNWEQGRTKAIWVSEKKKLLNDAQRDWKGLGQNPNAIFSIGKVQSGEPVKVAKGIGFITYDTLKGGMSDQASLARGSFVKKQQVKVNGQSGSVQRVEAGGRNAPNNVVVNLDNGTQITVKAHEVLAVGAANVKSRVDQIVDWVGKDFDGVIAFDEAHNMGNATSEKGERGTKDAAQKALAGLELQQRLPNARVVYVSATGATEVSNLAYADRLGLWGRGTAFASQAKFVAEVSGGGIAAMELIARDMKSLGLYTARNLSYDGVEYQRVEHKLDANQREIYDTLAEAWQNVLRNINAALEETGGNKDGRAKAAAKSAFWGGHQRFFNQIITSLQMPSVITAVEKDLAAGRQAVLQLTNTNEASQERAAAKAETAEQIEDLDITPRDQIIQLVEKSFPTQEYEQYVDQNGKARSRPVSDKNGNPVQNKKAVAMREALIDRLASVRVPQGPLDMVLDHFGIEVVAEVTGRGRRFVMKTDDKTGERKRTEESRPASANQAEIDSFQAGKKKLLIFSEAGGTGASYHADNTAPSKNARRAHYLVQGGWRADKAVQGFGRTHRTNQASAPIVSLVTTDLQGQKRFISSIARRLGQLGALTKGQRQAGDQGIFSARDNLESTEARQALQLFFSDILSDKIDGISLNAFEEQTGLKLRNTDDEGRSTGKQEMPPITQFLNRLLSLKVDMQNRVFEAFSDRLDAVIEARRQAGLLDVGLETVKADKITKDSEQVVHSIEGVGAETKHVKFTVADKFTPIDFDKVVARGRETSHKLQFFATSPNNKVYAVFEAPSLMDATAGTIIDSYRIINPVSGGRVIARKNIDQSQGKWVKIDKAAAEKRWAEETAKAPEFVTRDMHLITGAILPIWDRLKGSTRVVRLQTDSGERFLGRVVPNGQIGATLKALGAEAATSKIEPDALYQKIIAGGRATLSNGWTLSRRLVAGEHRIELKGPSSYSEGNEVKADGVFTERIAYEVRYFVPTNEAEGVKVIGKLTQYRPVVDMADAGVKAGEATANDDGDLFSAAPDAAPQTASPQFKRWFGKSKVADANGAPLVVYHGTTAAFDTFDPAKLGQSTRHPTSKLGFFFSASPDGASLFTQSLNDAVWPPKLVQRTGANLMPAYLSIKNPFKLSVEQFREINARPYGEEFEREQPEAAKRTQDWIAKNKAQIIAMGHDGIHIGGDPKYADRMGGEEYAADAWVAFEPSQIKSATGNRGTFDPEDRRATFSDAPRGWSEIEGWVQRRRMSDADQAKVREIVNRVARIDPSFVETIDIPPNSPGATAWGKAEGVGGKAAGVYRAADAIEVALDIGSPRTGYHEAFHRLQRHFLNGRERDILASEIEKLRDMIRGDIARRDVGRMAPEEVEAEAFAIFATNQDAGKKLNNILKRAWNRLRLMLNRLRNALNGMGYQTSEDIFGKAHSGEIADRLGEIADRSLAPVYESGKPVFSADADIGADGKPQLVLPGAERSTKQQVQKRTAEPKRSSKPQKTVDGLPLFNNEPDPQGDLFSLAQEPVTAADRQQVMQGFLARGQFLDRAIRVPFDIFGGITRDGTWKPGAKLFGKASNLITGAKFSVEGRLAFINPWMEAARAGLVDRYGLDPAYVERDRARALDERAVMLQGAEVLKTLKDHAVGPAEARVLQAILTGEDVTDRDMAALAEPIRAAVDQLGQEAVAMGLVSGESFERNRGTYLHRVYQKYEADQNGLVRTVNRIMGSRRKKIIGDQFRGRGIFQEVVLSRLMRDVPEWHDGARGKPQNGERFIRLDEMPSQAQLDLDENVNPEKPLRTVYWPADQAIPDRYAGFTNQGTFEVRGEKAGKIVIWRDFTKAERVKMGEILDARYTIGKTFMLMAHDLSVGKLYKDIAENEAWASSQPPAGVTIDAAEWAAQRQRYWKHGEVEWVKVPTTDIPDSGGKKRWGALAGKYVREEIWRDLNEQEIMNRPNVWRALLTQWKLNKTARNPVVHMNNVMSNFMLMDLLDVRFQDLAQGIRSYVTKDQHYEEAFQHGAFGADMISQEMRENVLKPVLAEIMRDNTFQQGGHLGALGQVSKFTELLYSAYQRFDKTMRDAYAVEDELFRMATYIRRRQLGDTPKQAADNAREQFIDYDIRAPWVNAARNTVLPFISYTYRAIPLVARAIATRPWKLGKYFALAYAANALAYALTGGDEDRERRSLDEKEQGHTWVGMFRMMRMPFNDKHDNPIFLDIRRWMPAGDVFDFNQGQAALPLIPAWLNIGGPLMLGAEFFLNRQAFTGQPITNDKTQDLWDKTKSVADWAWKSWMPSAAWVPGSWYWEKIENAVKGATDRQGRPYSLPLALSSSVGVKLKPQDVDDAMSWKGYEFNQVEKALELEMGRNAKRHERGMISDSAYNKAAQKLLEKMQRNGEKAAETLK